MTIEDVMALAYDLADDNVRALQPESVSQREDALRAAILALLDAESEACAELMSSGDFFRYIDHVQDMCECDARERAIRARIAARKGGAKP